ncbi:MAG: OmpH family outer membrane protein [Opitutaceae bacterium]|nr:OmpH family outer membrane protein [Verrucomicrobiales bacterium]
MNTTLRKYLLTLILLATVAITAGAQTPQKIGTVDLRKLFDNYYKTKQADAALKEEAAEMDKQRKDMIEKFRKDEQDYQTARDKASDQAVSAESRDKSKKEADKMLVDLKEREAVIQAFERTARTQLAEKQRRLRDKVLVEIREVINQKAKAAGFNLVLDSAADSFNQTPVLIYTAGDNDITEQVLGVLNANAPKEETKKAEELKK